jgi:hypothetical protein
LSARQRRERKDKSERAARAQIKRRRAHREESAKVILCRELAADKDSFASCQFLEPLLQIAAHVAIVDPGRIADDDTGPATGSGKGQGPRKIARHIRPDRVAPVTPELVENDIGFAEILTANFCSSVTSTR